jgi:hypothetical protein
MTTRPRTVLRPAMRITPLIPYSTIISQLLEYYRQHPLTSTFSWIALVLRTCYFHHFVFFSLLPFRYPHILAYLRTLPASPDCPPTLPRAVQLLPFPSRLETLLELRDEARYLGLEELYKLCVIEISLQSLPASEQHAKPASTHSTGAAGGAGTMEPVREVPEDDQNSSLLESRTIPIITRSEDGHFRSPSAPTLGITRTGSLNQRAKENFGSARSRMPQAGWI